eukprot:5087464-Prymnesium_polylepis.1
MGGMAKGCDGWVELRGRFGYDTAQRMPRRARLLLRPVHASQSSRAPERSAGRSIGQLADALPPTRHTSGFPSRTPACWGGGSGRAKALPHEKLAS